MITPSITVFEPVFTFLSRFRRDIREYCLYFHVENYLYHYHEKALCGCFKLLKHRWVWKERLVY